MSSNLSFLEVSEEFLPDQFLQNELVKITLCQLLDIVMVL